MSGVVADANVVVALLTGETLAGAAERALGDAEVFVPGICWIEVANALARKVALGALAPAEAHDALSLMRRLVSQTVDVRRHDHVSLDLAVMLGHDAHDCCYLAVAVAADAPLLTADRRLHARATAVGLGEHVVLVSDG